MKKQKSLGEQIREQISTSGKSHYQIAKDAGIMGSTLQRVMEEDWGNQLNTAEKILNSLGMDLIISTHTFTHT